MATTMLDEFILGRCNRFAHAVVSRFVEGRPGTYPIAALYGPEGAGKTHLVRACAGRLGARAACLGALDYWGAPRPDPLGAAPLDRVALVAVDDFDLVPDKVQRELLASARTVVDRGGAVLFVCETFPAHNARLTPDFLPFVDQGFVVDCHPLDPETRFTLAARVLAACGLAMPSDLLGWIRDRLPGHGLTVRGWATRFAATVDLTGKPPSAKLAERVLEEMRGHGAPSPEGEAVERAIRSLSRGRPMRRLQ